MFAPKQAFGSMKIIALYGFIIGHDLEYNCKICKWFKYISLWISVTIISNTQFNRLSISVTVIGCILL